MWYHSGRQTPAWWLLYPGPDMSHRTLRSHQMMHIRSVLSALWHNIQITVNLHRMQRYHLHRNQSDRWAHLLVPRHFLQRLGYPFLHIDQRVHRREESKSLHLPSGQTVLPSDAYSWSWNHRIRSRYSDPCRSALLPAISRSRRSRLELFFLSPYISLMGAASTLLCHRLRS